MSPKTISTPNPQWYKDAVIYELHVRAFSDSNGDGIGDFPGLIQKLDYLHDLGVTAIWLLPFYPSPLRDDGYDIADYAAIHPSYGTMDDFRRFLEEAHRRDLRVITELVINHTSSMHPWFQRARKSPPGSRWRDFYVWSDTPKRYQEARIIFQDFEHSNWTWDHVAGAYYWHRFYSHQPDLNFENLEVQTAIFETVDLWMKMGVDGLRLDAVPYLYEREGTNCENLPETHEFLKKLRAYVDARYSDRMLLAEANQWPEDAATYFGDGDECQMNFHFPVMPRMFMSVQLENRFPMIDILEQTPAIPDTCQWAVFLRNHDELTLEMVTDEDRDYMYRMYAADPKARINLGIRRRLAPLLKVRRKVELLNGLLFSLPGTPVLYYGDEIGMGDNIYLGDRDGVRTPMQWSPDRNAGFSYGNPQRLYLPVIIDPEYHFQAINVEAQQENPTSLLWWMKRLIAFRKQYRVFGRGTIEFLHPANPKVLAFIREHEGERILAVFNLSRYAQYVELDMSAYEGQLPFEIWGATQFPRIGTLPYLLTLGPHDFYWFSLQCPVENEDHRTFRPAIVTLANDEAVWRELAHPPLTRAIETFMATHKWFPARAGERAVTVREILPSVGPDVRFVIVESGSSYTQLEHYFLPLALRKAEDAAHLKAEHPEDVVAEVVFADGSEGILFDCSTSGELSEAMLQGFLGAELPMAQDPRLRWDVADAPEKTREVAAEDRRPWVLKVDSRHTTIAYGQKYVLRLFRRLEEGVRLDVEVPRYLSSQSSFTQSPVVLGTIDFKRASGSLTLGWVQEYVTNEGDAWSLALDELGRYYERALTSRHAAHEFTPAPRTLEDVLHETAPESISDFIGPFLTMALLLGRRTAELHVALCGPDEHVGFGPERFSTLHQRSLYQSVRGSLRQTFDALREHQFAETEDHGLALKVLAQQDTLDRLLRQIVGPKIETVRIRCHGDLSLEQVLHTGRDFAFIDFEGEPDRSLVERRLKRSPLRDVASMNRSFHYASLSALSNAGLRPEDAPLLKPWANLWVDWVCATYLRGWAEVCGPAGLLPVAPYGQILLDFYLIEKCIYELRYELAHRPDWAWIPLRGLEDLGQGS